ncbi:helix-turn-helix domain-containing protein [Meiothermus granaticius]|uniref:Transcriptional regulator, y4mF family n=1 Tax=Meiothermus granaticius NBRC 107808 TaxID=1227551 RepID=A0A399FDW6_9DEIN|nr:helix-turn-helix transcriptional regulator [Meiothermus granaticius]RIH94026.1 transcriptional regulator, y4mF family [Meiothermus granaticius NBRC 107808]GEM88145.1 hypothetical protein MGR01S_27700 [Meiothermus granaticius NBRC 107808]
MAKNWVVREPWGEVLFQRRKMLGLTQAQMQDRTGMSQSYVAHIEAGRYHPLQMAVTRLFPYIAALDWTLHEFLEATGLELPNADDVCPPCGPRARPGTHKAAGG